MSRIAEELPSILIVMVMLSLIHSLLLDLSIIDPEIIYEFLKNSPELIQQYVQKHVSKEELDAWLDLKTLEKFHERLSITGIDGQ